MMQEPKKPEKKIEILHSTTFDFNWVSKKVALSTFTDWVKNAVPKNAKDITLELVEEWQYDDCITYLELAWKEIKDNPNYKKDIAKYEKKLKKWKKQNLSK